MKPILLTGLLGCLLCSCSGHSERSNISEVRLMAPPVQKESAVGNSAGYDKAAKPEVQPTKAIADTSRKIIKEGDISFETNDIVKTRKSIVDTLQKLSGYISEEKETNDTDNGRKQFVLTIRVPSQNFDRFLSSAYATAFHVDSKNIRITDVTTQFIDITSQLKNKHILEERYLELLKKATKMSDMLEIESKLTEIRSDIESTQGQLNYLNKQVAFSSLELTFYTKQNAPEDKGYGFGYKVGHAFGSGWAWLQDLFFGLVSSWPAILIICFIIGMIRRWRKQRKLKTV